MKVAVFASFYTPEKNGIVNYVDALYGRLQQLQPHLETVIITFDTQHTGCYQEQNNGFKIYRLPCWNLLGGTYVIPSFLGMRKFKQLSDSESFQLVNTHTRFFVSSFLGFLLAKWKRIPLVHTEHGSTFVKEGSLFTRAIARMYDETLGRLIISGSDRLVGVSQSCLAFSYKLGGEGGMVISNAIDQTFWNPLPPQVKNPFQICFCGRLIKAKGIQYLLMALKDIENLPWELVIIGDGNYGKTLKEQSQRMGLSSRIQWTGSLHKEEIKTHLAESGIFVNPSLSEGMPTSVLEAGAMGCAIIATRVGGTADIIPNAQHGLLLDVDDVEELTARLRQAITTLLSEPQSQHAMGARVKQLINEKFTWDISAQQYIKCVNQIT